MNAFFARLSLVAVLAVGVGAAAARPSLEQGFSLLDQAAAGRLTEPDRSRQLAADAAAVLEAALPADAPANPAAQRALGNAHLLAGDLGRAVLAYRRAVVAAPSDPLARASLEHARTQVEAAPVSDLSTRGRSAVRWGRSVLPRKAIFWTASGVLAGACWLLAARLVRRGPAWAVTPAVMAGVLAASALGLLAAEPRLDDRQAAVVLRQAPARTGPHAEVYPPALEQPVPPGAEVRILETRDGWARCAIGPAQAWLPSDALEPVRPARLDRAANRAPETGPGE